MTKINLKGFKNQFLIGVCGLLIVATVLTAVDAVTSGIEISSLEKKEQALSDEKKVLQESLVKTLSTKALEEESQSLGFTRPVNIVYITGRPATAANLPQ
jgi:hypothetical protein